MRQRLALFLAVLAGLALAVGCSSSTDSATPGSTAGPGGTATPGPVGDEVTGTITVSAAASLTAPFTAIADDFMAANPGTTVELNLDSSGTLATQLVDGAPADVFASADQATMTKVVDAGLVAGEPQVFARNQLTIVVKAGNPKGVATLADLATVGTVSLCGPEVPCGRYADQILTDAGVAIPEGSITRGQNVKATLAAVAEGDAEAGIVYVTDVTGDAVEAVAIPPAQNVVATYPIAVLAGSGHAATADAFLAYVLGPEGQAVLAEAGFLPPS